MRKTIGAHDISGAVTVVVTRDKVLHREAAGLADIARKEPTQHETMFWIAPMGKPVTAVVLLMLQDEGELKMTDPVAKYIPEFASLKAPSGKPTDLTIAQLMTTLPAWPRETGRLATGRAGRSHCAVSGRPHAVCAGRPLR